MEKRAQVNDNLREREEEATEKETLQDLEESFGGSTEEPDDDELPSPDGSFDEDDELAQSDPM